ncbi:MAG: hypothetical protein DRN99_03940 [Thermoproteota archaeon]|nr:MAG: hypothetical protein DRN99_03940 [Candidatus Korarchaeota archaeon]
MLPSQLLRARASGGRLRVLWAYGSGTELELARELISVFRECVGRTLGELYSRIEDIERCYEVLGVDYKLVRGLATLLERRCRVARRPTRVDPAKARSIVFALCTEIAGGFTSTAEERKAVIEAAAKRLSMTAEELEHTLWCDSEGEMLVEEFSEVDERELLREYNLSLLQTALFKALRMSVETRAPGWELKQLLRAVKRLGLMYTAEKADRVKLIVDGPASLLKMTTRYGTALAKLVPHVVSMSSWAIRATVLKAGRKEALPLVVSDAERMLFPEAPPPEPEYDSAVEEEFASLMKGVGGWSVRREEEAILAGRTLILPDFCLTKGPLKAYVEIVGYWTPEYLSRKVKKLAEARAPILILADKQLACSRLEKLPHRVVYYEGKIPASEVAKWLSELEERAWGDISEILCRKLRELELKEPVVEVAELAKRLGASPRQLERLLKKRTPEGYVLSGGLLVSRKLIAEASAEVSGSRTFKEASEALLRLGVERKHHLEVLRLAGFKVVWRGLDLDSAVVV